MGTALGDADVVLLADRLSVSLPPARLHAVAAGLGIEGAGVPARTLAAAVVAAMFNGAASRPKAT